MRKNYLIGLALAAAIVVMPGCKGKKDAVQQDAVKKVLVTTKTAVLEQIPVEEQFTSTIAGYKENMIISTVAQRIDKIYVEVGDKVKKGQLLVSMEATQFNSTNSQLANAQAEYDRMLAVYKAGGISRQQIDAAELQVKLLRENIDYLKTNTELRSPIDGIVTARYYDPGNIFSAQAPILTVMQIDKVKVSVSVSEQYFPYVKLGMKADIRVDMYPDKVFEGKVTRIDPVIENNTRTFGVEITIPNNSLDLRPGMFSRTTLNFGTKEGIMVEDVAIQKLAGTNDKYLFLVENGKAVKKIVTTGTQIGSMINVLTGVNAGDEVVITGISRLENGTEVEVKN